MGHKSLPTNSTSMLVPNYYITTKNCILKILRTQKWSQMWLLNICLCSTKLSASGKQRNGSFKRWLLDWVLVTNRSMALLRVSSSKQLILCSRASALPLAHIFGMEQEDKFHVPSPRSRLGPDSTSRITSQTVTPPEGISGTLPHAI